MTTAKATLCSVSAQPSSWGERVLAGGVTFLLVGFAVVWAVTPHGGLTVNAVFIGAYGAAVTLIQVATALLLAWRARLVGDQRSAILAGIYVYSTPVVALYSLAFLFEPASHDAVAVGWLWLAWRVGYPLAIAGYALSHNRPGRLRATLVGALACSAVAIALAFSAVLPPLAVRGAYTLVGDVGNAFAVAAVVVALLCLLRLRPITSLDTWLLVVLAVVLVRYVLVSQNNLRLASAPDAVWIFSGLVSSLVITCALTFEFTRLLERGAALDSLYARENEILQRLQVAFLPSSLPDIAGVRFDRVYRPAREEFGGDWYDVFALRDGRLALVVGDMAGHGVDAAIEMVRMREALRAAASVTDAASPGDVLQAADRAFAAMVPERFATAVLALYDPLTGRLDYACAGHPPPALVRNNTTTFLCDASDLPLGLSLSLERSFPSASRLLQLGDRLVLYSDGLIESTRDVIAGQRRLADILTQTDDVPDILGATLAGVQRDDIALLQVTILGPFVQLTWSFVSDDAASAADARASFTTHLLRRDVEQTLLSAAELVFGELISNVVQHAPGPIEIELSWCEDVPTLVVRDRGPRFRLDRIMLPANVDAESGRGLYLISTVAAAPVIRHRPGGGNEVAVRFFKPGDDE